MNRGTPTSLEGGLINPDEIGTINGYSISEGEDTTHHCMLIIPS